MLSRPPAPRRPGVPPEAGSARPATPDPSGRAAVDAFCERARPWGARQARSYRHLPEHLRRLAVDRAIRALRAQPRSLTDARALQAGLADLLTEELRHAHAAWALDEAGGAPPSGPPLPDAVAGFIDDGLPG